VRAGYVSRLRRAVVAEYGGHQLATTVDAGLGKDGLDVVNIALATLYVVSIVAAAIGEWSYYVLGSVIESALLAAVVFFAWTWPKQNGQSG
jgi:hypothetical protein